jgi:hypothetical protein
MLNYKNAFYGNQPLFLEEDEDEVEVDSEVFSDNSSISNWWSNYDSSVKYSLFAIILCTSSDSQSVALIKNHRKEIAQLSGRNCCFIYFKSTDFADFQVDFHGEASLNFCSTFDIKSSKLPFIIFFERLDLPSFIPISLIGESTESSIRLIRRIFDHLNSNTYTLESVKSFSSGLSIRRLTKTVLEYIEKYSIKLIIEKIS